MKLPFMKLYPADVIADPQWSRLEGDEFSGFFRLLMQQWLSGDSSLPDDDRELSKLSGLHDRWTACAEAIRSRLIVHPLKGQGWLTHEATREAFDKAIRLFQAQSLGGVNRWKRNGQHSEDTNEESCEDTSMDTNEDSSRTPDRKLRTRTRTRVLVGGGSTGGVEIARSRTRAAAAREYVRRLEQQIKSDGATPGLLKELKAARGALQKILAEQIQGKFGHDDSTSKK